MRRIFARPGSPLVARAERPLQSVGRALEVLLCFARSDRPLSLTEIAVATGLAKSVAYRLLATLVLKGFLEASGDGARRSYRLSPRVLELGRAALRQTTIHDAAHPVLHELAQQTGENVNLAILDGLDILYVARIESRQILRTALQPGSRIPAHATAMGKVLLAHLSPEELDARLRGVELPRLTHRTLSDRDSLMAELERVRLRGYAIADEELELGVRSVAAPVRDHTGAVVAAVNVTGPTVRISDERLRQLAALVRDGAARISQRMGFGQGASTQAARRG